MNTATLLRLPLALAALLLAVLSLTACGGGDEEEDDGRATTGPVFCQQKPEICR